MKNITLDGVEYTPVVKEIEEVFLSLEQSLKFIIYSKDLGLMKWDDAIAACEALGDGWRLPTRMELLLIYEKKETITFLKEDSYWNSCEYSSPHSAWIQDIFGGLQYTCYKDNKYNVRAVKTIGNEK